MPLPVFRPPPVPLTSPSPGAFLGPVPGPGSRSCMSACSGSSVRLNMAGVGGLFRGLDARNAETRSSVRVRSLRKQANFCPRSVIDHQRVFLLPFFLDVVPARAGDRISFHRPLSCRHDTGAGGPADIADFSPCEMCTSRTDVRWVLCAGSVMGTFPSDAGDLWFFHGSMSYHNDAGGSGPADVADFPLCWIYSSRTGVRWVL